MREPGYGQPSPERTAGLVVMLAELAIRQAAVDGRPRLPADLRWLLAAWALNAPVTAVRCSHVQAVLDPEVRAAVARLASRARQVPPSEAPGESSRSAPGARPDPDGLVRTAEAARLLGVAPDSVRAAIRRGVLKASKDETGQWAIAVEDVEAYGRRHGRQAVAAGPASRAAT